MLVLQLKRFEFSARSRTKLGKVSLDQPAVLFDGPMAWTMMDHGVVFLSTAYLR